MNKLISVIVPIYNVDKYLEKCIESIINQTYHNLQIVLVDDGSTDSSGMICDYFKSLDNRIEVIHQKNSGLVAARKAGLKICSGDYVGFVDGDDYIDAEMYGELIAHIENTKADIVHSGYFKNNDTAIWGTVENSIYELNSNNIDEILHMLIAPMTSDKIVSASIWSKLYKREVILNSYEKVPNELFYGEDLLCFCNALMQGNRIAIINDAFYHYVIRSNSITQRVGMDLLSREYSLYQQLLVTLKENQKYRKYIETMLARNVSFALRKISSVKIRCYEYPNPKDVFGKKVIIYGAGMVGQDFYAQFSLYKDCNIIAWIDRAYSSFNLEYCEICPTEVLNSLEYDAIVIAVSNGNLAEEIINILLQMGVDKNKLVWKPPVYAISLGS